jgi:signal transduction histidine kinase
MMSSANHDRLDALEANLDAARQRIVELTTELDATNRGIIALHTELEAARETEARANAEREVLAERERIGRDLQDHVIHQVFDAAMRLQGILRVLPPATVQRVRDVVSQLDATIRDLRTAIFGLHDQPQQATSLRPVFANVVTEADAGIDFTPSVRFKGPIDAAVPDHIASDLLAATRDALTVAQSSGATRADVVLNATTDELVLNIHHDDTRHTDTDALVVLRDRAAAHSGTVDITTDPGGTTVTWRVPLPSVRPGSS